jgi:hypothetical protein
LKRTLWIAVLLIASPLAALAQKFEFPSAAAQDEASLSQALPGIASQVITVYKKGDRDPYLDNLFRLQMTEGKYTEAEATIAH